MTKLSPDLLATQRRLLVLITPFGQLPVDSTYEEAEEKLRNAEDHEMVEFVIAENGEKTLLRRESILNVQIAVPVNAGGPELIRAHPGQIQGLR